MGRMTRCTSIKRLGWISAIAAGAVLLAWPASAVAAGSTPPFHKTVLKNAVLKRVQVSGAPKLRPLVCEAGPGEMNAAGPVRRVRFLGSRPLVLKPACGGTPYQGGCAHRYADVDGRENWFGDVYKLRLNILWCWNGMSITRCERWPEVVYAYGNWEFLGWIGWRTTGGNGGVSCGAWVQAHMKATRPWYFDIRHYPWIEAVGQRDGYFGASAGGN
jgi:hypothetical protein